MTTPTPTPSGHIDIHLSPEESAFLARTGRDPVDFVTLIVPCTDRGVGIGNTPQGERMIVMNLQVMIPYGALPLKLSGLVGPDGNHQAAGSVTAQIPGAPLVRMLVARAALGADLQAFATTQIAAEVAAAEASAFSPRPMLSRLVLPADES